MYYIFVCKNNHLQIYENSINLVILTKHQTLKNMSSFANPSAWAWLIQIFIIVVALLIANLIRCNVPLFRRSLLPSALLAGLLILCLKPLGFFADMVNKTTMETIGSFIS